MTPISMDLMIQDIAAQQAEGLLVEIVTPLHNGFQPLGEIKRSRGGWVQFTLRGIGGTCFHFVPPEQVIGFRVRENDE